MIVILNKIEVITTYGKLLYKRVEIMIIEYDKKYDEQIKDLLVELQEHIQNIDLEGYNILTDEFRE